MVLSEHEFSSLGYSSQLMEKVIVLVAIMTGIAVS